MNSKQTFTIYLVALLVEAIRESEIQSRLFLISLWTWNWTVYHFSQTVKGLDWCNSNVESAFIAGQKTQLIWKGPDITILCSSFYFSTQKYFARHQKHFTA